MNEVEFSDDMYVVIRRRYTPLKKGKPQPAVNTDVEFKVVEKPNLDYHAMINIFTVSPRDKAKYAIVDKTTKGILMNGRAEMLYYSSKKEALAVALLITNLGRPCRVVQDPCNKSPGEPV